MMDFEIARYLYRVAFIYEIIHDNTFKSRAYFKAALAVDGYSTNIEKLHNEGKLRSLPSIGLSIEKNIIEIISGNHLSLIDKLLGNIPYSIFDLYEYSNIKKKLLQKLIKNEIFSFEQISDTLDRNADYLSLTDRQELRNALTCYQTRHFQYAQVYELANELKIHLHKFMLVHAISLSDELFYHNEYLFSGDIICTLISAFDQFLLYIKNIQAFKFISSKPELIVLERYGIIFNIHILSENDYNKKIKKLLIEKEKKQYHLSGKINNLYFNGDLHMHTNYSDGLHSIEQMRDMASLLGYKYIAITDHSQSSKPSGMSELDTLTQIKKIREMNIKSDIYILSGIEVDILADGSLDLPDNILKEFDLVIASIHSHFNQTPIELMERLEKALSNKYVNILAHPTGKLIGRPGKPTVQRKEMQIIFEDLLQICKKNNVALEVNCFPERFDLSISNAKKAVENGVKISVGTDSHSIYHMDCAKYALDSFQFAGFPQESILNCFSLDELKNILNSRRGDDNEKTISIFEEKFKDFNHYFGDNIDIISGKMKVIGIDLTGSEEKPSGFTVLSGTNVQTSLVLNDDEIVEQVKKTNPKIISIDSPLSLPENRCCADKNCDCAENGIMRHCELLLRHFGIGVYPCLIDSMVNLTLRGMKLTKKLQTLGFEVIESYPGVAQDLLHIPRKRKGLELLIKGMENFGIKGIQKKDITHDEVDAITSALVGYFYLNNKFTGIGKKKENELIVPSLETYLTGKGIILGLVGRIASGKTTIAEYLRFKYGFKSMRFSEIINEKYNVSGRKDLQDTGLEISKNYNKQKELSDIMISRIKEGGNYVIEGFRQIIDYENLKSILGNKLVFISIEASDNTRMKRFCKDNPKKSVNNFWETEAHAIEGAIEKISIKRDYEVKNNKSFKELMSQIDSLLFKLYG